MVIYFYMSKKIKQQNCAYCKKLCKTTKDHVIPRTIFNYILQIGGNVNPIIIPACETCNGDKSKVETYSSIMFSLASWLNPTKKQEKGFKHLSKGEKKSIANPKMEYKSINGICQQMAIIDLDFNKISKLGKYIAAGILYKHSNGSIFPLKDYANHNVSYVASSQEKNYFLNTAILANSGKYSYSNDSGAFNDKVKYHCLLSNNNDKATVAFQIYNPIFVDKNSNECCRVCVVEFYN